jgi:hypothetical protein
VSFEGPWRSDEQSAKGDLSTIRAAAASKTERSAAIQAMEQEADRLKDEAKTEASEGGIETVKGGHRARVRYTDSSGSQKQFRGPPRHDERRARADLEAMRAAAASEPARAAYFEAMANEAEVAIAVGKEQLDRKHLQTDSEPEPEQGGHRLRDP